MTFMTVEKLRLIIATEGEESVVNMINELHDICKSQSTQLAVAINGYRATLDELKLIKSYYEAERAVRKYFQKVNTEQIES